MSEKSSNQPQANFFGILPAHVRYCKELEPQAKLLYVEITALTQREGYCWATNAYFAEFFDVEDRTVQRWLDSLEKHGFIKREIENKGFKKERKIFIIGDGIKNFLRHDKNVMIDGDKNVTSGHGKNVICNKINELDKCLSNDKHIGVEVSAPPPTSPPCPRPAPQPRAISFSFEKKLFIDIEESDVAKWSTLYPAIDVKREISLMEEWCLANPQKTKSKKLWRKFIIGWLERQNELQINKQAKKDSTYVTNNQRPSYRGGNQAPTNRNTNCDDNGRPYLSREARLELLKAELP